MKYSIWLLLALALSGVAGAAETPIEASMVIAGTITVDPQGDVASYTLHDEDKVPPGVVQIVQRTIKGWQFVPIVQDGKAVTATAGMSVRVVADMVDEGHATIRVAGASFGCDAYQAKDLLPNACQPGTAIAYAANGRHPPEYPIRALKEGRLGRRGVPGGRGGPGWPSDPGRGETGKSVQSHWYSGDLPQGVRGQRECSGRQVAVRGANGRAASLERSLDSADTDCLYDWTFSAPRIWAMGCLHPRPGTRYSLGQGRRGKSCGQPGCSRGWRHALRTRHAFRAEIAVGYRRQPFLSGACLVRSPPSAAH